MSQNYEQSITLPLVKLQEEGKGEIFELPGGVLGFKKGKDPRVLITSCYHGPEIYGTYQGVLNFLESSSYDVMAIPVVDKINFEKNKEKDLESFDPSFHPSFLYDFIKGYNGIRPDKLKWQYGEDNAIPLVKEIEKLMNTSDLVIDVHNSCIDGYMFITAEDKDYYRKLSSLIEDDCYQGSITTKYTKIADGVFQCNEPKTTIDYARKNNLSSFILEVPVIKNISARNFNDLTEKTCSILEQSINNFLEAK